MESGIRAIPLGLFQIIAVVTCSALVTYFGHYVSQESSETFKTVTVADRPTCCRSRS